MYVYMYVYMYICLYVCICIHASICTLFMEEAKETLFIGYVENPINQEEKFLRNNICQ